MFVGHFAVAFAAKRFTPRLPLVILVAAVQLADVFWPIFILMGLEHARITPGITAASPLDLYDYPWSHSLLFSIVWSLLAAAAIWFWRKQIKEAAIVGFCVFSHFILDVASHRPDVPLSPWSSTYWGLGMWNSQVATVIIEGGLFAFALIVYLRSTQALNKKGSLGLYVLLAFLTLSWLSVIYGPPPPTIFVLAAGAPFLTVLILWWTHVIDKARQPRA